MVTVDLLRIAFEGIAGEYKPHLTFTQDTSAVLDRSADTRPPILLWKEPDPGMVQVSEILQDTFTLNMAFAEQTGSARPAAEMQAAYYRMCAFGKHIWTRFFDRYIVITSSIEGQELDIKLLGAVQFKRFVDEGPTMLTGCTLTATVQYMGAPDCVDPYFTP